MDCLDIYLTAYVYLSVNSQVYLGFYALLHFFFGQYGLTGEGTLNHDWIRLG
jgi:hypothetical protein